MGGVDSVMNRIGSIVERLSAPPPVASQRFSAVLSSVAGDDPAAPASGAAEGAAGARIRDTAPPSAYMTLGGLVGTAPATPVGRAVPGTEYVFPVAGVSPDDVVNSFGWPWGGHRHAGVDIFAAEGTPVFANAAGTIEFASEAPIGGNRVWIRGDDGRGYYYAHLSGYAPDITPGMHVGAGHVIGFVGRTGDAADTPPHLHFAVSRDNRKPGDSNDPAAAGWLDPGPFVGIAPAGARA